MSFPSRDDAATTPPACPTCGRPLAERRGRQRYCSPACRSTAWRRRRAVPAPALPPTASRRTHGVYECPQCEQRQVGNQRCADCGIFGRRLGDGGHCLECDTPLTVDELLSGV